MMRVAEQDPGTKARLRARSILYHDVVTGVQWDSSGFAGPGAAHYKLTSPEFEKHLEAIRRALVIPVTIFQSLDGSTAGRRLMLHFDDGGASSPRIADALEKYGWKGHFFVSTDFIGQAGFMSSAQIAELGRRGHVIGSHSCSHPRRMSVCSWEELLREWKQSAEILSQIVGQAITVASVPGGNSSRRVAEAAAECGMKVLFTSDPTTRVHEADGCLVLGRYGVVRETSAEEAAALASGAWFACTKQLVTWKTKMAVKSVVGNNYERFRDLCFGERHAVKAQGARY